MPVVFTPKHYKLTKTLRRTLLSLSIIFWATASILLVTPVIPHILYRLSPQTPQVLAQNIGVTFDDLKDLKPKKTILPLPPLDETLPKDNRLIIRKIGVDGIVHEGDWEVALLEGIWREQRFGTPDSELPTVIAAHRWGYL